MIKDNEYQCAYCGGIFEKGQTDEEAWEEHDNNFPGASHATAAVICDDCYNEMIVVHPPPGMRNPIKDNQIKLKLRKSWLWRLLHFRHMRTVKIWFVKWE